MRSSVADILVDPAAHSDGSVDEVFGALRAEAPVSYCEPTGFPPFWSVVRHDDVRTVYVDPEVYGSTRGVLLRPSELGDDPGGGLTLALSDPPRHGALRRILAPRFDQRAARRLHTTMRRDVDDILDAAAAHETVDFAHEVAERLSSMLIARLLGVPSEDLAQVCHWISESFAAGRPMTSHQQLASYVMEMVYTRMEEPSDDAVGLLVDGEAEGELLSDTEILLNVENLLGASENAGLSLASGVLALVLHPEEQARLAADPAMVPAAGEEMLRWASSATHSMRVTRQDAVLAGTEIPAGERVVVWVRSANRDEAAFDSPDEFRVDRRPNRHLALGTGEHVCIGQTMARHQMRMVLEALTTRVSTIELAGEVRWISSLAVSGPATLPMRIRMR